MFITREIYSERFVVMTARAARTSITRVSNSTAFPRERGEVGKSTRTLAKAAEVFNIYDDMFIRRYVLLIDALKIGLR